MTSNRTSSKPLGLELDRLTNLPDEILGQILSLLPTKAVAATQLLSKRMRRSLSLITSVDLDDFPISHCHCRMNKQRGTPLVELFPLFKSFVTNVLHEVVQPLTRFRLCFGSKGPVDSVQFCSSRFCLRYLEPARFNKWISYPSTHSSLRELELAFHVRNRDECKLFPQLFHFPLLEFFRVDANIKIISADIPLISLPNLKLMHFKSVEFTGDDFVTRLVSGCTSLEDFSIKGCMWEKIVRMTISSHSLRKMYLSLYKEGDPDEITELVTINTPNLQYLTFLDDLPLRYSITHMNVLVKANVGSYDRNIEDLETCVRSALSLLSALTDVQHLLLYQESVQTMLLVAELEYDLPAFRSLKTIKLPPAGINDHMWRWDIVLFMILRSSPLLENLVFQRCISVSVYKSYFPLSDAEEFEEEAYLEVEAWRTNTLPSCCLRHLKRIEFGICFGIDRELNMIKFFLGKASVLKELVLRLCKDFDNPYGRPFPKPNFEEFVSKLEELPKVSNSCSIIVC